MTLLGCTACSCAIGGSQLFSLMSTEQWKPKELVSVQLEEALCSPGLGADLEVGSPLTILSLGRLRLVAPQGTQMSLNPSSRKHFSPIPPGWTEPASADRVYTRGPGITICPASPSIFPQLYHHSYHLTRSLELLHS